MNEYENNWKTMAMNLWLSLRILFISVITWDFFLTVVSNTSQRSLTLLGIGSWLSPVIIGLWIFGILGLSILLFSLVGQTGKDRVKYSFASYLLLGMMIFVYVILSILAIVNSVALAVIVSSAVNAIWAGMLIYFRFKITELKQLG